ncbi:hypothetical protein [Flavobacterium sp. 25HG05S-40]|uniref:hypothetical protein n=1 Tax=Flavobacterium sp. 25HG05S-40 TaxID=3458682 RepID=UPI0040449C8D
MRLLKKISIRFFFLYFLLTIAPWLWFEFIPGFNYIAMGYRFVMKGIVTFFNDHLLHVKEVLNINGNGSGDTSYAWAEFYTIIMLSFFIAILWSLLDKKDKPNSMFTYWLPNLIRYNIIFVGLSYGIIKIFAQQMPFPTLSQLATPLGDFLPMRLSWMFMGYSQPYQMFSGVMELMVALLLLYKRTIPLGLIIGLGVFVNVFALNLSYDIPVKLYSMQIVLCCLYLLLIDYKKYLNFFILGKPATPTNNYEHRFTKRWQRIITIAFKAVFLLFFIGWNIVDCIRWHQETHTLENICIPHGVYNIKTFKKNHRITAIDAMDTLSWKDFVFDKQKKGSMKTKDTMFLNRYGRAYFIYDVDKSKQTINFKEGSNDSVGLFTMKYKLIDKRTLQLEGIFKKDTLFYELVRNEKPFPLAEKQFHWISEANR